MRHTLCRCTFLVSTTRRLRLHPPARQLCSLWLAPNYYNCRKYSHCCPTLIITKCNWFPRLCSKEAPPTYYWFLLRPIWAPCSLLGRNQMLTRVSYRIFVGGGKQSIIGNTVCVRSTLPLGGLGICSSRKFFGNLGPLSTCCYFCHNKIFSINLKLRGNPRESPPLYETLLTMFTMQAGPHPVLL